VSNASFGIYIPRFTGTIYELLSAPVSVLELLLGFVGAAATKSIVLGLLILVTRDSPDGSRFGCNVPRICRL
jgi:ABC-2 type transport system permease protein